MLLDQNNGTENNFYSILSDITIILKIYLYLNKTKIIDNDTTVYSTVYTDVIIFTIIKNNNSTTKNIYR